VEKHNAIDQGRWPKQHDNGSNLEYYRTFPQVDGLLKECRILEQSHRRDIDRRDAILQMLERDIEEADEQYLVIVRSYLRDMDKLLDLQVR
jgi:hypothetical protein